MNKSRESALWRKGRKKRKKKRGEKGRDRRGRDEGNGEITGESMLLYASMHSNEYMV